MPIGQPFKRTASHVLIFTEDSHSTYFAGAYVVVADDLDQARDVYAVTVLSNQQNTELKLPGFVDECASEEEMYVLDCDKDNYAVSNRINDTAIEAYEAASEEFPGQFDIHTKIPLTTEDSPHTPIHYTWPGTDKWGCNADVGQGSLVLREVIAVPEQQARIIAFTMHEG